MSDNRWQFELEEYIKQGEPEQVEKSEDWKTAIVKRIMKSLQNRNYIRSESGKRYGKCEVLTKSPKW